MTSLLSPPTPPGVPASRTLADLLECLGGISPARVLLRPAPGMAVVADLVAMDRNGELLPELVEGTLVERAMGFRESALAGVLIALLRDFVVPRNLGVVTGEAGLVELAAGLVRGPDVAFTSWDRIRGRRMPDDAFPRLAPDLAVEILSPGNTPAEMARKRREYFGAGVRLVWEVDPVRRTVAVYTSPEGPTVLDAAQTLDGGDVLPGLSIALASVFAELDRQAGA